LRSRINANANLPVTVLDRNRVTELDTGKFLALDNQVDTQTGTIRAKGRFDNAKSMLFPSQFVNVRLLLRTIEGTLVVPVSAVRHGGNGDFVYVLNPAEKTVSLRAVKRGQSMVDKVEIVSGLKPGEQVITEGADRLRDGAKVSLPGERPGGNRGPGARRGNGEGGGNGAAAGQGTRSPQGAQGPQGPDAQASAGQAPAAQPAGERRRRTEAPNP
jgi:multidrug efflux system membrane fusion protein